jgi:hypothetical protein
VELRLRASKRYVIGFFHSVHHPLAVNGFVHSKLTLVEHRTDTLPPAAVHLITRTQSSITFGWAPSDIVSLKQQFEATLTPIPTGVLGRLTDVEGNVNKANLAALLDANAMDLAAAASNYRAENRIITSTPTDPQNHATFTNLAPAVHYAFRIRCLVSDGPPSAWSEPIVCTTLLPPRPVEKLSALNVTANSVKLCWVDRQTVAGEGMTYFVSYRATEQQQPMDGKRAVGFVGVGGGGLKPQLPSRANVPSQQQPPVGSLFGPPPGLSAALNATTASNSSSTFHGGELVVRECVADITGLFPGTQYRFSVVPQNHGGQKCTTNSNILVRTAGLSQWKV